MLRNKLIAGIFFTLLLWGVALADGFKDITPAEANEMIKKNPAYVVLDVRTPEEYGAGHLANSVNIDFYKDSFKEEMGKLDKSKTYIIYCKSGGRSKKTHNMLKDLGFKEAYNVLGGYTKWAEEGLPTVK